MHRKDDYEVIDDKVALKKWKPNLLIKIGVGLNITFAALLSIPVFTLPITIPAIVMNALLLIPIVDTKRYHAYWRWIPIALVLMLTAVIVTAVVISVLAINSLWMLFSNFMNTIIFWTDLNWIDRLDFWLDTFAITLTAIGSSGSVLIILGWYKGQKIGMIELTEDDLEKYEKKQMKKKHHN